ncbi:sigma-70 family RNA polymerase sigma factor [Pseudanabaenaceae cyanobacterium LEGE 13415]|nr:sigma-70 family RNA polymerase sigma factor [Pseudanabaenaceae cyanobacterium LEGE 13415]
MSFIQSPLSLDQLVGDDAIVQDLLSSEQDSSNRSTIGFMLRQDTETALGDLPARERDILALRFGLMTGESLSFSQIGRRLNLSRERVRQLEHRTLNHLKRRQSHLRDYLIG